MLLQFNVKNYLSFDEKQNFSMVSGDPTYLKHHLIKDKDINLLKFAAIYGPNAAGKSNLIKALNFSKRAILSGLKNSDRNKYFKLRDTCKKEISTFEYEIKIGTRYFAYGFNARLSERQFTGEWLYELSSKGETLLFERNILAGTYKKGDLFDDNEMHLMRFNVYLDDISSNHQALFLTEINRNNHSFFNKYKKFHVFNQVHKWFVNTLDINFPDRPISDMRFLLDSTQDANKEIFKLLENLGTGITNFELIDSSIEELRRQMPKELIKDIENEFEKGEIDGLHIRGANNLHIITFDEDKGIVIKTVYFTHGTHDARFTLDEESDGTRRLLDLLEILLGERNKVYVIDELDRSLHPNLTYKFLELFFEVLEKRNIQLIITTHEDRILDLNLLRRDEIWFVEKQEKGDSLLYPLDKFNKRFDEKVLTAYLEGRFGAVPKFKNLPAFSGDNK